MFVQRIEQTLDRALSRNSLGGDWTAYVRGSFRQVPWLQEWFERKSELWFWFAVDQAEMLRKADLLSALRGGSGRAVTAFDMLDSCAAIPEVAPAAEILVDSAVRQRRTDNLGWLFSDLIERGRVAAAIVLAETSWQRHVGPESAMLLFTVDAGDDQSRRDLALALRRELDASLIVPHGTAMCGLLIATSPMIDIGNRLTGVLADQLGNPLAEILTGVAAAGLSSFGAEASHEIAARACSLNPDLIDRLWQYLSHPGNALTSLEDFFLGLMLDPKFPVSRGNEKIGFVADLLRRFQGELPSSPLSQIEVELVRRLLKDRKDLIVDALARAGRLTQFANGLQLVGKVSVVRPVNPDLIVDVIRARIEGSTAAELLLGMLSQWDWHQEPVWRILFLPWAEIYDSSESPAVKERWNVGISLLAGWGSVIKLAAEEKRILSGLSLSQFLALAAFGVDVPTDARLLDAPRVAKEMQPFSAPALEALARFFHRSDAILGVLDVADILVTRVSVSPSETERLLEALSRSKWMPRLTREDLSPLVRAARTALSMLSREQYDMFKCRLEGLDRDADRHS
jgi:hypothetical protein